MTEVALASCGSFLTWPNNSFFQYPRNQSTHNKCFYSETILGIKRCSHMERPCRFSCNRDRGKEARGSWDTRHRRKELTCIPRRGTPRHEPNPPREVWEFVVLLKFQVVGWTPLNNEKNCSYHVCSPKSQIWNHACLLSPYTFLSFLCLWCWWWQVLFM